MRGVSSRSASGQWPRGARHLAARGCAALLVLGAIRGPLALAQGGGAARPPAPEAGQAPGAGSPGSAAPEAPWRRGVSAERRAKAIALLRQGNHFHERLQYSQALTFYRQALAEWDHPAIQFNMADCFVNMDLPLEAYGAVTAALRFGRRPLSAAQYRQALSFQKLLRARLAEVAVEAPQPGVKVALDGKPFFVGPGQRTRLVLPGEHLVVGTLVGHISFTRKVSVFSGRVARVRVRLASVESIVRRRKVVLTRRWALWKPWVVLAAGAVVTGIGVPLLLKARSDRDAFDRYMDANCASGCSPDTVPASILDRQDRSDLASGFSVALFTLGGAALVTGAVLLLLNRAKGVTVEAPSASPSDSALSRLRLLPGVGPQGALLRAEIDF